MANSSSGNGPSQTIRTDVQMEDGGSIGRILRQVEQLQNAVNTLRESFSLGKKIDADGEQGLATIRKLSSAVRDMQKQLQESGKLSLISGGLSPEAMARGQYAKGQNKALEEAAKLELEVYKNQVLQGKVTKEQLEKEQNLNRVLAARKVLMDQQATGTGGRWVNTRLAAVEQNISKRETEAEVLKAHDVALRMNAAFDKATLDAQAKAMAKQSDVMKKAHEKDLEDQKKAQEKALAEHEEALREDAIRTKKAQEKALAEHEAALKEDAIRTKKSYEEAEALHEAALKEKVIREKRAYEKAEALHEAALTEDAIRTKKAQEKALAEHEAALKEDAIRTKKAYEAAEALHEAALKEKVIREKRAQAEIDRLHEAALREDHQRQLKARQQALYNSPEAQEGRLNDQREHTRKRLFGDGGAHLLTVQAGLMANYAILSGFQSLFVGATNAAVQFDQSLRQLQAITATTNNDMVRLSESLVDVAHGSKFSAVEVANAAVLLGQAGLSIAQIQGSMKAIITLAQASGSELKESVDVVTSVLGVFNKDASQTMTIANQMTQALNSSKLDMQKLSLGLQYAGNTAADSGVSFEELTAALGAMANSGIKSGSTLGTGLRQILIDIQKPSEAFKDTLDRLGLTLNDVDFRTQGFEGVLQNLESHGFTAADAFQSFEVRAASAFAALSNNTDVFRQLEEDLRGTEAALAANDVQMASLSNQASKLVSNLGIMSSKALQPMLLLTRDLTKSLANLIIQSEEWGTTLKAVGSVISSVFLGLAVRGLGAMTAGMVGMAGGVGNLVVSTDLLTASMTRLTGAFIEFRAVGIGAGLLGAAAGMMTLTVAIAPLLVTLGALYFAFRSSTKESEKLTEALDQQKAKLAAANENFTKQREAIDRLDAASAKLRLRHGALSESQDLLQSTVKELTAQFEENGLVIDDVAGKSVDGLIKKLGELRQSMSADFLIKIREQYQAKGDTLNLEIKQRESQAREAGGELNKALLAFKGDLNPEALAVLQKVATFGVFGGSRGGMTPKDIPQGRQELYGLRTVNASNDAAVELIDKALEVLQYAESRQGKILQEQGLKKDQSVDQGFVSLQSAELARTGTSSDFWEKLVVAQNDYSNKKQAHETNTVDFLKKTTDWLDTEIKEAQAENAEIKKNTDALSLSRKKYNDWKIGILSAEKSAMDKDLQDQQGTMAKLDIEELKARRDRAQRMLSAAKALLGSASTAGDVSSAAAQGRSALGELGSIKIALMHLKKKGGDRVPEIEALLKEGEEFSQEAFTTVVTAARNRVKESLKTLGREIESFTAGQQKQELQDYVGDFVTIQSDFLKATLSAQKTALEDLQRQLDAMNGDLAKYGVSDRSRKALEDKIKALKQSQEDELLQQLKDQMRDFETLMAPLQARRAEAAGVVTDRSQKIQDIRKRALGAGGVTPAQQSQIDDLQSQQQNASALVEAMDSQISRLEQENSQLRQKLQDLGVLVANRPAKDARPSRKAQFGAAVDNLQFAQEGKEASLWYETTKAGVDGLTRGLADLMTQAQLTGHTTSEAFRQMGVSILQTMLSIVNEQIARQFISLIFGGKDGKGQDSPLMTGVGHLISGIGSALGFGAPKSSGGPILRRAGGGAVPGNLARDSVPTLLMPGEFVLQQSAASALGGDYLNKLNQQTEATVRQNASKSQKAAENDSTNPGAPTLVNVWVVTPDQQTGMSKDDIIVTVGDNISRGGSLKRLIKQVQVGG